MPSSSFFYEIELKSLLEWRDLSRLRNRELEERYDFIKKEHKAKEILVPGYSFFLFNHDEVHYVTKDVGDMICKRVVREELSRSEYPTRMRKLFKEGKRLVWRRESTRTIYHTHVEGDLYQIYLEAIENFGNILKIKHETDKEPDVGLHAFRIRRIMVELGLEVVLPSEMRDKVVDFKRRCRHSV